MENLKWAISHEKGPALLEYTAYLFTLTMLPTFSIFDSSIFRFLIIYMNYTAYLFMILIPLVSFSHFSKDMSLELGQWLTAK